MQLTLTVIPNRFSFSMAASCRVRSRFAAFQAAVDDIPVTDPAVDPPADLRVHRTDGNGHMGDLDLGQRLDIRADSHPVGRNAEKDIGKLPPDRAQGCHRLVPVGERVAGTGDTGHRDPRFLVDDLAHVDPRLFRGENRAGNARTRLVHTVVFPVAEIAFDIAFRSDGQVDASILTLGIRVKTGVAMEVFLYKCFHGSILIFSVI